MGTTGICLLIMWVLFILAIIIDRINIDAESDELDFISHVMQFIGIAIGVIGIFL
jgi:hypothetical protein